MKFFARIFYPSKARTLDENIKAEQVIPVKYDNGRFYKDRSAIFSKISADKRSSGSNHRVSECS